MKFDLWQTKRENNNNKHYFDKNGNLAINVFYDLSGAKPIVAMFVGKALKPKHYYSFRCELDAVRFIKTRSEYELNNINAKIDKKAEEREQKKNFKTSLKVGDIMHGSWGYDMTINEFYQIVNIKNKTITLREIGVERKASGYYYEEVKPEQNCFIGEPIKRILQVSFYDGKANEYIKLNDVCNLRKCENINRYFCENHWD